MTRKKERLIRARQLKELGVPFILRHTLAKKAYGFEGYFLQKVGQEKASIKLCDCCSPKTVVHWKGYEFQISSYGMIDVCKKLSKT